MKPTRILLAGSPRAAGFPGAAVPASPGFIVRQHLVWFLAIPVLDYQIPRRQLSAEHPFDLPATEMNVDRASVRAVGFEFGAIEVGEQRMDFRELENAADAD